MRGASERGDRPAAWRLRRRRPRPRARRCAPSRRAGLALDAHEAAGLLDEAIDLDSPSPVPLPEGLVVKKGSNARASTSGVMPSPVSVDLELHVVARLRAFLVCESCRVNVRSAVAMVSAPPSGMASRALIARLSSAISSWLASQKMFQRPLCGANLQIDEGAERAPDQFLDVGEQLGRLDGARLQRLRRENASRRLVSAAALSAACRIAGYSCRPRRCGPARRGAPSASGRW